MLAGIYPILVTTFHEDGSLDIASQLKLTDFLLEQGAHGLGLFGNASEGYALEASERIELMRAIAKHVGGRVPLVASSGATGTRSAVELSKQLAGLGADALMVLPPFFLKTDGDGLMHYFNEISNAAPIPIMVQDAPLLTQVAMPPALLARMAREIEQLSYFKIETAGAASKLRELIRLGGDAVEGPWDGEEAITLLPDLDAGATGAMTGGAYPDGIRPIIEAHRAGDRDKAYALYQQWLPLINYENRQSGILTAKALMREGGVIACEAPRHPFPEMHPDVRKGLIETAQRLDPLVLRWGH